MIKILVIDDKKDNLVTVKALLKQLEPEYEVLTAQSGIEGIKLAKSKQPDTILLDVQMPIMDGYEVCRRLRADKTTDRIPIVFLTAVKISLDYRIKGLEMGGDSYLIKPVDSAELLATLHAMLRIKKAEDERLHQYKDIVSSSTDMLALLDKQFTYLTVNQAYLDAFDKKSNEVVGHKPSEIFGDEYFETVIKPRGQRCLFGETVNFQTWIDFPAYEKKRFMDVTYSPYIDDNNKIEGFVVNGRDITDRKLAEEALKLSEEKYRGIFDESVTAIYLFDAQKNFVDSNQAGLNLLGYSRDELLKMSIPEVDADPETVLAAHQQLLAGDRIINYEHRLKRKDGSIITVLNNSKPVVDVDGNVVGIQSTLINITERKQAEVALRKNEEKWRSLTENSPNHIILLDMDYKIRFINHTVPDLTKEQVIGKPVFDFVPSDYHHVALECFKRIIQSGKTDRYETQYITVDGKTLFFDVRVSPLMDSDGNIINLISSSTDVTERKQAEDHIQYLNNVLMAIRDINQLIVTEKDQLKLQQTSCEILNQNKDYDLVWIGLVEEGTKNVLPTAQAGLDKDYIKSVKITWDDSKTGRGPTGTAIKTKKPFVMRDIAGDPRYDPWRDEAMKRGYSSSIAVPLVHENRVFGALNIYTARSDIFNEEEISLLVEVCQDIAFAIHSIELEEKRKQAVKELQVSEKKYKQLIDNAYEGIYIAQDGMLVFANPMANKIMGYNNEELFSNPFTDFIHPDDQKLVYENYVKRLKGEKVPDNYTFRIIDKKGRIKWLSIHSIMIEWDGKPATLNFSSNITKQLQAENALHESEKKFRSVVESSPMGMHMYHLESDGRLVFVGANNAADRILGVDNNRFIGKTIEEAFPPLIATELPNRYRLAAAKGESWSTEQVIYEDEKIAGVFEVYAFQTEPNKMVAMFNDVTKRKQIEETLLESEERYHSLSEAAFEAIFISEKGICLEQNIVAEKMFGYTSSEAVGRYGTEWIIPTDRQLVMNNMLSGNEGPYETTALRKDGTTFPCEIQARMMHYKGREVRVTALNDITKRKQAEKELKKFNKIIETTTQSVIVTDLEGKILYINPGYFVFSGFKEEETIGKSMFQFTSKEGADKLQNEIVPALINTGNWHGEMEVIKKDKRIVLVELICSLLTDNQGNPESLVAVFTDITERKRVENELKESEELNKSIAETAGDAIISINDDGNILSWNKAAERSFGYSSSEMVNRDLSLIIPAQFIDGHHSALKRLKNRGKEKLIGQTIELTALRKDGTEFPVELSLSSWKKDNNKYFVSILRDITERKLAEKEITMLAHALKSINECVSITDLQDTILFVNQSFVDTYGYQEDELIGKNINIIRSPNNPPDIVESILSDTIRDGWSGELINRRKDGTDFPVQISTTAIRDADNRVIALIGVANDITERKLAEEALQESEKKFRDVIEQSNDGIYVLQGDRFVFINHRFTEITGFVLEEISSKDFDFNTLVAEEGLHVLEKREELRKQGEEIPSRYIFKAIRKDGQKRDMEVSVTLVDWQGKPATLGVVNDVTKRIQTQLKLEKALEDAKQGIKVKSQFMANMSHEIRTPLNTILGFTDLIEESTRHVIGEEEKKFFRVISSSGQRLMHTVHEILDISQIDAGTYTVKIENYNLVPMIQEIVDGMQIRAQEKQLLLTFHSTRKKVIIRADRDGISQTIINIIDNAIKYTEKGEITVGLRQKSKCAILTIQDTGIGMSQEYLEKIYEAFTQESEGYTKKYQGIGLGMAIVKGHLDMNQVDIDVDSTKGKGTIFTLTFPDPHTISYEQVKSKNDEDS